MGKILGLASVKYVLFPRYRRYWSFLGFGHLPVFEGLFDPGEIIEDRLALQSDLEELPGPGAVTTTKGFLVLIYGLAP